MPIVPLISNEKEAPKPPSIADMDGYSPSISLQTSSPRSPEEAAKILDLEKKSGIPGMFIQEDLQGFETEFNKQSFDPEVFRALNPRFSEWVSRNPNHYSLVREDLGFFGNLERSVQDFKRGFQSSDAQVEFSDLIHKEIGGGVLTPAEDLRINKLLAKMQPNPGEKGFEYAARSSGYGFGQFVQSLEQGSKGAATGLLAGATIGFAVPGIGTVAGGLGGATSGFLSANALQAYRLESAFAYHEFKNLTDELGNPIDRDSIKPVSHAVGVINAAIETGSDALLLRLIPGAKYLTGGLTRQAVTAATKKALAIPTVRNALLSSAAKMTGAASLEATEEFFQALVAASGREVAQGISGQSFQDDSISEDISSAASQAKDAFASTALSIAPFVGGANFFAKMQQVKQSKASENFYTDLSKVTETKTFQLNQDKGEEAIKEIVTNTPYEKTYIPIESFNTFYQDKADPREVAAEVFQDGGKAYDEAVAGGNDLVLPTERYARKIAANPEAAQFFAKEVRHDEFGMSAKEAEVYFQNIEQEEIINDPLETAEQKVFDDVKVGLESQGIDRASASQIAKLNSRVYRTLISRSEMTPEEFLQKYRITFGSPIITDQTFNQDTPEFKNFIQGSQVVQSDGKAKIVYHGSPESFEVFDPSKFETTSLGRGFYFTDNEIEALDYGPVRAFYLNIKKPANLEEKTITKSQIKKIIQIALKEDPDALSNWGDIKTENKTKLINQATDAAYKNSNDVDIINSLYSDVFFNNWDRSAKAVLDVTGFDGVIKKFDNGSTHYVSFFPEQIKSIENIGLFNPNDPNVYRQEGKRGQIQIGPNHTFNISLFKEKNLSTPLHELSHAYLEILRDLASTNEDFRNELDIIKKELGATSDTFTVDQHETWARSFEAYLMEGKAPSTALRRAFFHFKQWLLNIYKTVKNLRVELSPEIKGVFDRLLATEEEIQAARNEAQLNPIFGDFEQARASGMSVENARKYAQAVQDARRVSEERLAQQIIDDWKRQDYQWYKSQRDQVKEEVISEVDALPVYRALQKLRDKENGFKLLRSDIVDRYGSQGLRRLPRPYVYSKDGLQLDVAAGALGFSDGDELYTALVNSPNREELIEKRTDQRMNEIYPDLYLSEDISKQALEIVHNEKTALIKRMELQHLATNNLPLLKEVIRKVTRRVPSNEAVREDALKVIGRIKVTDLKPYVFQRAEVKAAKEAGELLTKGDLQGAFDAKLKELISHERYRAAVEAKEAIEKGFESFKKLRKSDDDLRKTREINLVNAARALLSSFGIGQNPGRSVESYLSAIESYEPDQYQAIKAMIESATDNGVRHFSELSVNDYLALKQTFDAIWSLSKSLKSMDIEDQLVQKESAIEELNNQIVKLGGTVGGKRVYAKDSTKWNNTKMALLSMIASHRRVESWASAMDLGKIDGPFRKYFYQPIANATAQYRLEKKNVLDKKYRSLIKKYEHIFKRPGKINAPELQDSFVNIQQLIGALLHTGNQSNFQKLLRGYGWGSIDENGILDTSRWDAFIQRMWSEKVLTKDHYDFVQEVWDLLDSFKPMTQKAHKKMYGFYFNEITARKFSTPFGEYRGGYVPAKIDPTKVSEQESRLEREALENLGNTFAFPTTGRGATFSRNEQYAKPLILDLGMIPAHIDWALRFTYIEPAVKDVMKILKDRSFSNTLEGWDQYAQSRILIPFLQRAAQQKVETPSKPVFKYIDVFARYLRKVAGMQVMFLNDTNTIQQFTGLSVAMVKVDPKHLRNALFEVITSPKETIKYIQDASDFMKTRTSTQLVEVSDQINELVINASKYKKFENFAQRHAYILQTHTQAFVDQIVWIGAYNQAVEKNLSEEKAVQSADSAVRETQGSFNPEDVSAIETGTPAFRLFTMFFSYFNMLANTLGTEFSNTIREMGLKKGYGQLLYIYTFGFMVPAVLSQLIVKAMSDRPFDEDDDDSYLDDFLSVFFWSQMQTTISSVAFGNATVGTIINNLDDNRWNDDVRLSPAISSLQSAAQGAGALNRSIFADEDMIDALSKRDINNIFTLLGFLTGTPVAPLSKPLNSILDEGE